MDLAAYRRLHATARRCARRPEEAEDLLQDALLAGLEQGRDDPAWLAGTIRNLASMQARGAVRRRRRESLAALGEGGESCAGALALDPDTRLPTVAPPEPVPSPSALLAALPPSARRLAVLALHGLNAEEIRCVLGIADTAFRQRLSTIRKVLGVLPPTQRAEALALAYVRDPARSVDLQFGLVRRALKAALGGRHGLGTHDTDGHLLVLRTAGGQTPPPASDRKNRKGGDRDGRAHTSAGDGNT